MPANARNKGVSTRNANDDDPPPFRGHRHCRRLHTLGREGADRTAGDQDRRAERHVGAVPRRDRHGLGGCAQQAVRQFNSAGFDVQVLAADHQNKPDVGAAVARQWFDRDGVDVIMDVPTSSVALAVNSIAKEKNKLYINTGAGTGDLTGAQCTPSPSTGPTTPTCWPAPPRRR